MGAVLVVFAPRVVVVVCASAISAIVPSVSCIVIIISPSPPAIVSARLSSSVVAVTVAVVVVVVVLPSILLRDFSVSVKVAAAWFAVYAAPVAVCGTAATTVPISILTVALSVGKTR